MKSLFAIKASSKRGRGPWFRIVARATKKLAKDSAGEALDHGGYDSREEAQTEVDRLDRRPEARALPRGELRRCQFVLCRNWAMFDATGMAYCPRHTEMRGHRVPERART